MNYSLSNFAQALADKGAHDMIMNVAQSIPGILTFVSGFSLLAGILIVIQGVQMLMDTNQSHSRHTVLGSIGVVVVGLLLISSPSLMWIVTDTLMGTTSDTSAAYTMLAYENNASLDSTANDILKVVFQFGMVIGAISVIRSLFIFHGVSLDKQGATVGKAFIYAIAGGLALNMQWVISVMKATALGG